MRDVKRRRDSGNVDVTDEGCSIVFKGRGVKIRGDVGRTRYQRRGLSGRR